jgi:hypothetical protein
MSHIEGLQTTIHKKREQLNPQVRILHPEHNLTASVQAGWMIQLLAKTYVSHGIAKVPDQVRSSIESGETTCWFAEKDGEPVGIASLITQSDGSAELGRAVATEKGQGIGGILMLMAAVRHLSRSNNPLVAEVRVSDEFAGIPSGEATQKICFGHIGLIPHALVPAFHHGEPDRNEQFAFSSSQKLKIPEVMHIPNVRGARELLFATAVTLARHATESITTWDRGTAPPFKGWSIVNGPPFSLVVPEGLRMSERSLEKAVGEAEKSHPFTLIPVEMEPSMTGAIVECLSSGFAPCGVDRNPGEGGHPVLLLGKLRSDTLLAPMKLLDSAVPPQVRGAMTVIDDQFRKRR